MQKFVAPSAPLFPGTPSAVGTEMHCQATILGSSHEIIWSYCSFNTGTGCGNLEGAIMIGDRDYFFGIAEVDANGVVSFSGLDMSKARRLAKLINEHNGQKLSGVGDGAWNDLVEEIRTDIESTVPKSFPVTSGVGDRA